MELIIVTGMSGAGKSLASNALEDIGYYCVDNMPPTLMRPFLELCKQSAHPHQRIALVTDVRSGDLFEELQAVLPHLESAVDTCRVLFLDCNTEVLRRRFKETRRHHPLSDNTHPIEEALKEERQRLAPLFDMADYRIDTTHLNSAQLKTRIADMFMNQPDTEMTVQIMSFGFKYGFPAEADIMLDARCLPNPYYLDDLRPLTGMDRPVQTYVMDNPDAQIYVDRLESLLTHLLPLYQKEARSQLVIAIGCTGGKHRSVTLVNKLAERLHTHKVRVYHRDMGKE